MAIGAKPRADLVLSHIVPQFDAKKRWNSMSIVRIPSVCCTCVPGLLPLIPSFCLTHWNCEAFLRTTACH